MTAMENKCRNKREDRSEIAYNNVRIEQIGRQFYTRQRQSNYIRYVDVNHFNIPSGGNIGTFK